MAVPSFPTLAGMMIQLPRTAIGKFETHEAIGGTRSIVPLRSQMRYRWEISVSTLRSRLFGLGAYDEFERLNAFYASIVTSGLCFGYTDPDDYIASTQNFGQGDGTTTQFQLVRAQGGFAQPVYLAAPTSVTVAGVATSYTLSAKGVVTFASPPASGAALAWSGTFQWLCRFDKQEQAFERVVGALYEVKSLTFSSEINP